MHTAHSIKQVVMYQLLSVPILKNNTYLLYSLWSVVLILSYYEFGFQVIYISSNHVFNFFLTCIINVIAYVIVEKLHSRLGNKQLFSICVILYGITHVLECFFAGQKHEECLPCDTGLDIAGQFGVTGLYGLIFTFSNDVYNEVIRENAKEEAKTVGHGKQIPIDIRDITLAKSVYPRLLNVYCWLKKRHSDKLGDQDFTKIDEMLNAHILCLRTGKASEKSQSYYSTRDITVDDRRCFEDTCSAVKHIEGLINTYVKSDVPFVILYQFNLDEMGCIVKEDKKLISHVQKKILPKLTNTNIEVVYTIDGETKVDLKGISCTIQYKLGTKGCTNRIYCKTFNAGDHGDVKKRIGLYFEKMFQASVVSIIKGRHSGLSYNGGMSQETLQIKTHNDSEQSYDKIQPWKEEIISHLEHSSPDHCEMHELKVLLERSTDVAAYGFEDSKIMVFVKDQEKIPDVRLYLNKYFADVENKTIFKNWENKQKISKCLLEQGSKTVREDKKFGTLGMFLQDDRGNIYFTTCSHVHEKDQIARGVDDTIIGRSVFSVDTMTDTNYSELIDLSIIKVEDSVKPYCRFGLRNVQDNHEFGDIIGEDSVQPDLKVYKWGAATSLTRGTYKGWIAPKDQNCRFDKNLHKIVSDSTNMFEEGDSGSLVCVEATGSPHLDSEFAAFIFVGKWMSSKECSSPLGDDNHWYYCYHISKVFQQQVDDVNNLEPCLEPNAPNV